MNTILNIVITYNDEYKAVVTKSDNLYDIQWMRNGNNYEDVTMTKDEFTNWLEHELDQWK